MITLSVGPTTIELPDDLYWSDENSWFPVEQDVQRTITGALIVSAAQRIAGRSITLEPFEEGAWMPAATLDQIKAWASVPGQEMTLTLRGVARQVIFRHQDGEPVAADPVVHYTDVASTDWYMVTLRFMEI